MRRLCSAIPTQIISDGARGVLAEREMRVECLLAAQGVHFGPPKTCCARGCAKTGPGVGLLWREKVVGHLPRGALSGDRGVPPQRGVFWGRCAGIRAAILCPARIPRSAARDRAARTDQRPIGRHSLLSRSPRRAACGGGRAPVGVPPALSGGPSMRSWRSRNVWPA
jgi:hypothetical protein